MEESYAPVKAAAPSPAPVIGWNPQETMQALKASPPHSPKLRRPELSQEHWQMSPADCTQGLGMDLYGTDVATMMDAGWQVMLWPNEPLISIKTEAALNTRGTSWLVNGPPNGCDHKKELPFRSTNIHQFGLNTILGCHALLVIWLMTFETRFFVISLAAVEDAP